MKKILDISLGVGVGFLTYLLYERIVKFKYETLFNEILDEACFF